MKALKMTRRKLKSKDRKSVVLRGFHDANDYMADLKRSGYEEVSTDEPGADLVQMVVDRGWVERGIEGGKAFAEQVLALPKSALGYVILVFAGFDFDSRELHQIPEVREFCRGFLYHDPIRVWPYLLVETPLIQQGISVLPGMLLLTAFAHPELTYRPSTTPGENDLVDFGVCHDLVLEGLERAIRAETGESKTETLGKYGYGKSRTGRTTKNG